MKFLYLLFFLNVLPVAFALDQDAVPLVRAQLSDIQAVETPRFTLYIDTDQESGAKQNDQSHHLVESSIQILNETYEELSRIFLTRPSQKVILRFLPPQQLHREIGAPEWTSAMYYRGEITIPIAGNIIQRTPDLRRALRHEYTHAVVAELSARRCPAWLDEGLAQLIEGQPNPLLGPALREWMQNNTAMPFQWLENGFVTLDQKMVPAAYAQSLFTTRSFINRFGFKAIRHYLSLLKEGELEAKAFELAFGKTKEQYEKQLTWQMTQWAESDLESP